MMTLLWDYCPRYFEHFFELKNVSTGDIIIIVYDGNYFKGFLIKDAGNV